MKYYDKEIWCTVGPATLNDYTFTRLTDLGVSLLRINLSHTKLKDVANVIQYIQARTSIPICLDTEGAQIRTSDLDNSKIFLRENTIVYAHRQIISCDAGNISFYPREIIGLIEVGDFISIDFNSVLAQVIDKNNDKLALRILIGGSVEGNKAVTVLNRDIEMSVLTEKDREALVIGADLNIRHAALSFANRGTDVDKLRGLCAKGTFVISKIESIEGVYNIEEIANKSDVLLLDRGDLSRQVNIEQVPALQKEIISCAKRLNKKIYVATNLLESMVISPTPTRAEVNDIFNTLADGADGLVLAAETAIGSFPVHCVMMISKIIQQFSSFSDGIFFKNLRQKDYLLLIKPHGGILVDRIKNPIEINIEEIKEHKILIVDQTVLMNAEQIAVGAFSPLEGFMNREEVNSVLSQYRLPNGIIWPLPIVLQVKKEVISRIKVGETVSLILEGTSDIYALLYVEDIYTYGLDRMCMETFGTNDQGHPGVALLKKNDNYFLGGKIELIKRLSSEYKHYELTPIEVRTIFENKGWSKVVGFHSRNVIHRVHEHIQLAALEQFHCDGLFVHPVIGLKKRGDYSAAVIIKAYELMLKRYYPKGKVVLSAFQNYSRYSGPREAVFTALCRKNFGCSHFIVGRDHTGVGNYYAPDDAKKLFYDLEDIGIVPLFFGELHYCEKCNSYVEHCEHGNQYKLKISGSEGRKMFEAQSSPPDWFMRKDITDCILQEIKDGGEIFVK